MHCYLARSLSDVELEAWLRRRFPEERFRINGDPAPGEVWVESRPQQEGDFPWFVEVYRGPTPFKVRMEQAAALAADHQCAALVPDERPAPFSYVLLTPTGERLWVDVDSHALDEREALVIAGPARHPEGRFSSFTALEPAVLTHALSKLLEADESRIRVEAWVGPEALPPTPFDAWHPIVDGVHYRFTYSVSVRRERRPWRALADDAAWCEHFVSRLAAMLGQPLCAHAEYFEQVANIPGGSDSERRCIWVDGVSRREVVTKRRRVSW
ncbi:hypothetical protein HPC49_31105 [Pyxidicoccus fallax]|uniref:Uncharacterized protein n=1 Tax=Pyxidicoccus fallax TaxID=394095 RepID=A0A848LDX1_9BACT|nr:hypothetical protein [Pyxidicoccus fallax]NMO15015.1 hypothetical protein [Pyxidicoccus fallax]NPC82659.1 hypothetical protein [Pyxidicoccus fallax]